MFASRKGAPVAEGSRVPANAIDTSFVSALAAPYAAALLGAEDRKFLVEDHSRNIIFFSTGNREPQWHFSQPFELIKATPMTSCDVCGPPDGFKRAT